MKPYRALSIAAILALVATGTHGRKPTGLRPRAANRGSKKKCGMSWCCCPSMACSITWRSRSRAARSRSWGRWPSRS